MSDLEDILNLDSMSISRPSPKEKMDYKANVRSIADPLVLKDNENLDEWKGFSPSKCSVEDGISYIQVFAPGVNESSSFPVSEEDIEKLKKEFKNIPKIRVTKDKILELGKKYKYTSGKLIVWLPTEVLDQTWQKAARMLLDGKLPGVTLIKTPAQDDRAENVEKSDDRKISFVTKDYSDISEIERISKILRDAGINFKQKYKPDIYTTLGIFARNEYGIHPMIFEHLGNLQNSGRGRGRGYQGRRRRGPRY